LKRVEDNKKDEIGANNITLKNKLFERSRKLSV